MVLPISYAPAEQSIGGSFGTGLGQGLQNLLNMKLQEVQRQKQAAGLAALLPNLNQQQALAATYAPEKVLSEYTKRKLLEPSQQAYLRLLQQQLQEEPTTGAETAGTGTTAALPKELQNAGISEQQATKLAEFGFKKREEKAKEQRHYEKLYQKQIDRIETEGKAASKAYDITKRMSDVIKTDKAQLGSIVAGKFTPQQWLNEATQDLISLGNDLVLKKAQLGKGVPTKFRLAMEELAKPGIWMQPSVAQARIKDIQKELIDDMAEQRALEVVQEKYGVGKQFKPQLNKEKKKQLEELKKSMKQSAPQENVFEQLPDATQYEGKTAKNPATGQRMKAVNGKWEPIGV